MLVKPGAAHSVELLWNAETGQFLCWYINLQEPLRRTPLGFDTMDLVGQWNALMVTLTDLDRRLSAESRELLGHAA